jgi:hypothetical protein
VGNLVTDLIISEDSSQIYTVVPDWGDKVDSDIGSLYRPARLHRLAGRYDNPMPESCHSWTMNLSQNKKVDSESEIRSNKIWWSEIRILQ